MSLTLVSFGQKLTYSKDYNGNTVAKDEYGNIVFTIPLNKYAVNNSYGCRLSINFFGWIFTADEKNALPIPVKQ